MHLSEWAAEPLHFGVLKHSSNARKQGVFTCTHTLWWICYQMKMMKKNNYNKGFCLHVGKKTIKTFCFFYWANICVVMGPTSWIYILFGFGLFSSWYLSCTTWSLKDFLFHWASLAALSTDGSVRSQAAAWHWTLEFGWLTLEFCTVEAELRADSLLKEKDCPFCFFVVGLQLLNSGVSRVDTSRTGSYQLCSKAL